MDDTPRIRKKIIPKIIVNLYDEICDKLDTIESNIGQVSYDSVKSDDSISDSGSSKTGSESSKTDNYIELSTPHIYKEEIEKIAGITIVERKVKKYKNMTNIEIYQQALVHKSVQGVVKKCEGPVCNYMRESNEKLEFLGDSVLGTSVTKFLFHKYPEANEGILTKMRTRVVRSSTLARFAEKIGIKDNILMSPYVIKAGGKENKRFLEDAFEAFVGAMSLDLGEEQTDKFILNILENHITDKEIEKDENYKDLLLRYTQFNKFEPPQYITTSTDGPPNNCIFTIEVSLIGEVMGIGIERTKKKAEQIASKQAVNKMRITEDVFKQERPQ
jgi:ribonuclease-3